MWTSTPTEHQRQEQAPAEQLFALHYIELRRLAESRLRRRGTVQRLNATALVHEAYLSMVARGEAAFPDRARFLAYASRAMRGLLIDHARRQHAKKRGQQYEIAFEENGELAPENCAGPVTELALGDALADLAKAEPGLAELVELRFFAGLSFIEIAALRGSSERSVRRDWEKARTLLQRALLDEHDTSVST
jgi:RNA polymerase sigma factor (TIGR02999 family)